MRKISRRRFAGLLISVPLVPSLPDSLAESLAPRVSTSDTFPESVAGHIMTAEEKQLARAFLDHHEQSMMPLRARVLPNDLQPFDFCHFTPKSTGKR